MQNFNVGVINHKSAGILKPTDLILFSAHENFVYIIFFSIIERHSKYYFLKIFVVFHSMKYTMKENVERLITLKKTGFVNIIMLFLFLVSAKKLCYPLAFEKKLYLCCSCMLFISYFLLKPLYFIFLK